MVITSHGHSDVGFVRENNEDSFLVDDSKGIYCVADGVGGLPFGNLASRMAVKLFAAGGSVRTVSFRFSAKTSSSPQVEKHGFLHPADLI